jgi:D-glycero-D-manno-heptose 1,7-bisphosphate phosphatase
MCSAIFRNRIRIVETGGMNLERFRHVILDRDGVLNREAESGDYVREPSQFHWLPGALEGLTILRRAGIRLSVATNQSGVGRGLMNLEQLAAVHARMQADAAAHGGALDAVLVCPHAPEEECVCRKPAPGLIRAAIERAGICAGESLVVGDDQRDLEAARRAGVAAALVRTGKGRQTEQLLCGAGVPAYDDLSQLARELVGNPAPAVEERAR